MRRACGQACCWGGAAVVAPERVCTKVMALQPGPASRPGGEAARVRRDGPLHLAGRPVQDRRPPRPHRGAAAARVARPAHSIVGACCDACDSLLAHALHSNVKASACSRRPGLQSKQHQLCIRLHICSLRSYEPQTLPLYVYICEQLLDRNLLCNIARILIDTHMRSDMSHAEMSADFAVERNCSRQRSSMFCSRARSL